MVAKVVGNLTLVSSNPTQTYRITILNSPNVNAFALPGGYLYVTRGLLALANDSSELAAVIAHEMGHVTANHGLQRQKLEAEEELATKVVSDVLGESPSDQGGADPRQAAGSRSSRATRSSRPTRSASSRPAVPATIRSPRRASCSRCRPIATCAASPARPTPASTSWRATPMRRSASSSRCAMPASSARRASAAATATPSSPASTACCSAIRPMKAMCAARPSCTRGSASRSRFPSGFVIDNSAAAVTATGPGDIAVRFDGVAIDKNVSLVDYVKSGWVAGLEETSVLAETINGNEAAIARAEAGGWRFDITVIRAGDQVYRLLTAAPQQSQQLDDVAQFVGSSFKMLTSSEKAALKPLRIKVVTVQPGETIGTLAAAMSGVDKKLELFRVLNEIAPGGERLVGPEGEDHHRPLLSGDAARRALTPTAGRTPDWP